MQEEQNTQEIIDTTDYRQIRLDKLNHLKEEGADPFQLTSYPVSVKNAQLKEQYEQKEKAVFASADGDEEKIQAGLNQIKEETVYIAGRVMSWRKMGKAHFIDVRDHTDRMQVYVRMNDIGKEAFEAFKKWDIGDILGIEGYVFRTQKGEISVHAKSVTLLAKSLLPLPEKWHGLKDQDTRYRQRYLDLICNPEVKEVFVKRSQIMREIRNYLDNSGYVEVDTPVLLICICGLKQN